jgi:hypothetical protein
VNGIGLMSLALLSVGSLLPVGIMTGNSMLTALATLFIVAGTLGLLDDLVFNERLTKKLLRLW